MVSGGLRPKEAAYPVDPLLVTIAEAARRTSLSRPSIYRLIERGELEAVKVGTKSVRIPTGALEAFVDRLRATAGPGAA